MTGKTTINAKQSLASLDEQKLGKQHFRMVLTAGMGFFTDAYDLFVIGVVTALLIPIWHLSVTEIAFLNGASLASAAFGAVFFGWCADKFGRKKMYGLEMLILIIGALASALSPSFIFLLLARILVGVGIGGDYPSSAVVASEHANRKNRGFLVLLVFAMQAVGLIIGPLFAAALISLHISHAWVWRILLGFGAIPAASVLYLRRQLRESLRFEAAQQAPLEASRAVSEISGFKDGVVSKQVFPAKLFSKKWLRCLLGTAGAWFCLDVAFYGNGVSSMLIMKKIAPNSSLLNHTLLSALIFLVFAVPGYAMAAKFVDKVGRKPLQIFGFGIMAMCYLGIAFVPHIQTILPLFIGVFGISFFFVNFGPNSTTFLIPSEVFPTKIRARGHGLSAATGKMGAFIGAFFLPLLLAAQGLSFTMAMLSIVAVVGMALTLLVPEMKGVALD